MEALEKRQEPLAPKKRRFGKKGRLAVGAVAAVVALGLIVPRLGGDGAAAVADYTAEQAQRRDISTTVSGSATLEPADSYQVNTLISGTVLSAPFEEDELVEQGALLYELDSGDARSSVSRAGLSVAEAQLSYAQAKDAQHPTAPISGTVSEVCVHNGDDVAAGAALLKIAADTELSVDFLFTYAAPGAFYVGQEAQVSIGSFEEPVTGTVTAVSDGAAITGSGMQGSSVRVKLKNPGAVSAGSTATAVIGNYSSYGKASVTLPDTVTVYAAAGGSVSGLQKLVGSTVKKGETLCTLTSAAIETQIESARLGLEGARLSASSASSALEDYRITAPISGTVIEKNFKAGDKVDGSTSGTMAVIYDMSSLKMQMNVNELDIGKVRVGQQVDVTAAALPGEHFVGTVERVSVNGSTTDGFTTYPVTVSIAQFGALMPGMNVSAAIQCDTVRQAVTVPVAAVARGDTVLVAPAGALDENGHVSDPAQLEERTVALGRSDDAYIEITSGLADGEWVAWQTAPEAQ